MSAHKLLISPRVQSAHGCKRLTAVAASRWGLWAPFDFLSSMAIDVAGFSPSLGLYLISVIKYCSSLLLFLL